MANFNQMNTEDRKISGLPDRTPKAAPAPAPESGRTQQSKKNKGFGRRDQRFWITVLVDLVLLLVLAGLAVGAYFAYGAIYDLYAPEWETRDVVFTVELENVPAHLVRKNSLGVYTLVGMDLWSSDRTDADRLGTVTAVTEQIRPLEDMTETVTLRLTVEARAYYRTGKGYRMGETMLLAGTEGDFRTEGLVARGVIISMAEKPAETPGNAE